MQILLYIGNLIFTISHAVTKKLALNFGTLPNRLLPVSLISAYLIN